LPRIIFDSWLIPAAARNGVASENVAASDFTLGTDF
jgi:hypothetical protein